MSLFNANYSVIEKILLGIDRGLRHAGTNNKPASDTYQARPNPAADVASTTLSMVDTTKAIEMMRVNHSGEVCAQALYRGQALFARSKTNSAKLLQAAQEEDDHLAWCNQRLQQLGGKTSIFNPLWYAGSFAIGAAASLVGDSFSFGFLAETEVQVAEHLSGHLNKISIADQQTRVILEQMKVDEIKHATTALNNSGEQLPAAIKILMRATAKIMTTVASKV